MKTKILNKISLVSIALFILLSLFSRIDIITANGIGPSQRFNTNFVLEEYSKFNETSQKVNFVDLTLPSSSWSIQDIKLNFTNIQFIENNTIEDKQYGNSYEINFQNEPQKLLGVGVQIQLNVSTTIYGVYIYARKLITTTEIIQVQLRGYDSVHDAPNNTIYYSTNISVNTTAGWYFQNFSSEGISLPIGNYFLVLNGTNMLSGPNTYYYWYYNDIDPKNPNLNVSEYIDPPWPDGVLGNVPLYKLVQRVNLPLYPEEINMTVNINDQIYDISNGINNGEGYLEKILVDFSPNSDNYQISVYNNATESLFFNVSFFVTLTNNLLAPSSVVAQLGATNKWSVTPTIVRQPTNYSVLFNYPSSWENISVLKDEVDITSSVLVDTTDHKIIVLNDSISDGADWEIVADSTNVEFILNVQRTEYILGQELQFSLLTPILSGTYTFVLLDSAGIPIQNQTITYPSETIFSYDLSLTDLDGTYTAYVFWFSDGEINAGVQSQEFSISLSGPTPPPTPEFPLPLIIFIIILGAIVLGLVSYIAYKRINSYQRNKLEKFLSQCTDISNINEIIVIDTKSGIDIFSKSLGGRKLDTSLISGFLQAISNFGTAMSEAAKESRTLNIVYKDSIVMQTEFVNLKLIITLKENPSPSFKFIMEDLAYEIYKQYGGEIDKFAGILKPFKNMNDLIEKHLNISFLYKLSVKQNPKIKLSTYEKEMVNKALTFMKENKFDYFYSLYLMPENMCSPKDYKTIFNLIEKGIFQPKKE
jgi:hypothetical protein